MSARSTDHEYAGWPGEHLAEREAHLVVRAPRVRQQNRRRDRVELEELPVGHAREQPGRRGEDRVRVPLPAAAARQWRERGSRR